jgi:hypothetical protein
MFVSGHKSRAGVKSQKNTPKKGVDAKRNKLLKQQPRAARGWEHAIGEAANPGIE